MTGHNNSIQTQNPSFMTTLQATLDILDDVSGTMPENTYLTITNNLQQLYNIHTSNPTSYANPPITTPINYTRNDYVSTISYASTSNFDISYASLSNFDISNANTANANTANANTANVNTANANTANANTAITNNNNNNNNNENIQSRIQSRIQSLNEESNRIGYSTRTHLALYNNVFNA